MMDSHHHFIKKQRAACVFGPAVRHRPKVRYRAPALLGDGTTTLTRARRFARHLDAGGFKNA